MSPAVKRAWLCAGLLAALVLVLDQVAKAIVEDQIVIGEQIEVLGPLEFTLAHNRGVAFGIAGGAGAPLVLVTLFALGVVLFLFSRTPTRPWMWVAVGLLVGGALGNLVDRVRLGHVTDYIDLPPWPPFNLADVSITFGVILLVILYLFDTGAQARDATEAKEGGAEGERA
ncbi:MAG TPA: signal peptidase II [Solirubrobacterales bacterium]|nr:signal peptidase II [Solirubrobacterales bacterium]